MDKLQLKASLRDLKKTRPAKLRKAGQLPAVLYGHKVENVALSVNEREFEKLLRKAGESTIVEIITDDGKIHPVLIYDIQKHFLTSVPTHVDFYEVSMTEKLKAKVALEFTGEAPAVKQLGGVLVKVLSEIEVECLPVDLPHSITVSLNSLANIQDAIHVKDLAVPDKVKILAPADDLVAKIQPPRDVEAELAAPVVEDISKVEGAAEVKATAEGEAAAGDKKDKPEKAEKSDLPAGKAGKKPAKE